MNILIAGGTDGIGYGFLNLVRQKWNFNKIYVLGRHFDHIDQTNIIKLQCDITTENDLIEKLAEITDHSLDIFVNTIGSFCKYQESLFKPETVKRHFDLNASSNINLLVGVLPKLKKNGQIMICLSSICDYQKGRLEYGLQGATKMAYKYYIDSLSLEMKKKNPEMRIMTINPSGVQTNIFEKGDDFRSTVSYATVEQIANIMEFQLLLPRNITIPHLVIYNQ